MPAKVTRSAKEGKGAGGGVGRKNGMMAACAVLPKFCHEIPQTRQFPRPFLADGASYPENPLRADYAAVCKTALVLGLLYCLSPWDVIPEWVPVLGVMDDLALAALLVAWANRMALPDAPPEHAPHDAEETPER